MVTFLNKYCNETWKTVVSDLETDIYKGLNEEESAKRRNKIGSNQIKLPYSKNNFMVYIKSALHIYTLICVSIIAFLIFEKEYGMVFISTVFFISNIAVKVYFTYKKEKEMAMLQNINNANAKVLRNGRKTLVKFEDIVKGDIVFFKAGTSIPADIRIIEANNIKVDEKSITGENFLKEKFESKISSPISNIGEMRNILFKGSVVKEGDGFGVVTETGENTQLGKLLMMLIYANKSKHTLDAKIDSYLGKVVSALTGSCLVLYFLFFYLSVALSNLALSLFIVSIIPAGITLLLEAIIIKKDLEKEGIELINLSTLDTINEIDVIFLDKVGSISKEKMQVNKIYTDGEVFSYDDIDYEKNDSTKRLIQILLLSNNAKYNPENDSGVGDLAEIAYLSLAANKKAYKSAIDAQYKRIFDIPMDSDQRIYTTVNMHKSGYRANVHGNVDAIVEKCTSILMDGSEREITEEDIELIKAMDYNFSLEGIIPQAAAYRNFNYKPTDSENIASNLVFVGVIGLENPLVDNAKQRVDQIKRRGIVPILFTDDNKISSFAIGKAVGFLNDSNGVISGVELDKLSQDETINILSRARVFSRVNPEIKSKIVGLFTKDNYIVAAAGETLGDLPSISLAKVGIGKGTAQSIVKKVSDVFIKENYLNKFLKLFDVSKNLRNSVSTLVKILSATILSELLMIQLFSIINNNRQLDFLYLFIINLILFIPLSLIMFRQKIKKYNLITYLVRFILWTSLSVAATIDLSFANTEYNLLYLMVLPVIIFTHATIYFIRNFDKMNLSLIIAAASVWIISLIIFYFAMNNRLTIFDLIRVLVIIVVNIAIEVLLKLKTEL